MVGALPKPFSQFFPFNDSGSKLLKALEWCAAAPV